MDGKAIFVATLGIFWWVVFVPSHRYSNLHHKMRVHRFVAVLAGSRTEFVDGEAFAFQVGFLSMLLWDILLTRFGISNFAYSVLLASITILLLRKTFRLHMEKQDQNSSH